jgi:hypothetical protein
MKTCVIIFDKNTPFFAMEFGSPKIWISWLVHGNWKVHIDFHSKFHIICGVTWNNICVCGSHPWKIVAKF